MIEVSNIKKVFQLGQQKVEALKGINLKVEKEDFVSIMGPSGSGKTTLMNIIGCLDTPSSGNYYLNNQLVSELDDDALNRQFNTYEWNFDPPTAGLMTQNNFQETTVEIIQTTVSPSIGVGYSLTLTI